MNTGKTLFAQLMDFLPWSTFTRIVARYGGDARVRTLCCAEQYRAMAFAQLTYRESLRDIETCLRSLQPKLYHAGFRGTISRSTLADANLELETGYYLLAIRRAGRYLYRPRSDVEFEAAAKVWTEALWPAFVQDGGRRRQVAFEELDGPSLVPTQAR